MMQIVFNINLLNIILKEIKDTYSSLNAAKKTKNRIVWNTSKVVFFEKKGFLEILLTDFTQ